MPKAESIRPSSSRFRLAAGGGLCYLYNGWLTRFPSRFVRKAFLRRYLAGFGNGSAVQLGVRFLNGRKISLGPRNVINFDTLLDGRKFPIETGADVSIGPEAAILTLGHDPQSPDFADEGGPVRIGDYVWIAYRAVVLPGVTIGEGAVIGAGAVVTRDVPPYAIMAGSPARQIGIRTADLTYRLNFDPSFL